MAKAKTKKKDVELTEDIPQIEPQKPLVTDEDFNLAIQAISEWHKERNIAGFAIINTSSFLMAWQGNRLAIEAAVRHSYEQIHGETAVSLMQARQASEASKQVQAESAETSKDN